MPESLPSPRAALAYSGAERHPLVEAFLERRWRRRERDLSGAPARAGQGRDPCLEIAAGDEMFAYALTEQHQHRGQALVSYLRSGLTAAETLSQILAWRFGALDRVPSVLDFASGYGRTTRFLADAIGADRITVGEISEPALEFQASTFGVSTVRSHRDPGRLELEHGYAAVLALSLFTHLPEGLFRTWLERLWRTVEPGGVLVFSVNDQAVLFPGLEMPEEGLLFEPFSENRSLDADSYGSTWVTDRFVREAIAEACAGAAGIHRVERGLWHFQDLYVVERPAGDAATLERSREPLVVALPPEGYLDTCIALDDRTLQVAGWAIDRAVPARCPEIRILVGGEEASSPVLADRERADLAALLGEPFRRSGWLVEIERSSGFAPHDTLLVEARAGNGRATVLHLSEVEGADLTRRLSGALEETRAQNLHLRAENVELERRLRAMEQSRFWKARNAWFRLQHKLGIRRTAR